MRHIRRQLAAVGIAALIALLFAAACSSGSKPKPAPTEPPATAEATAAPGACPVEAQICQFAEAVETAQRDNRLAASFGKDNQVAIKAASRADDILNATGGGARVTTIGCPLSNGAVDCSARFAITLSSLPRGLEEQDGRGLAILFFERSPAGVGASPLVAEYEPPAGRSLLVSGGDRTFCEGVSGQPGCVDYRLLPFSTGAPEPGAPVTTGKLPPLRQVSGATSFEMTLSRPYTIKPGELWYFKYLCDACGPGPFPNLYRAYRASDGTLVVDDLKARITALGLGSVVSFLADWQNGDAWIATCSEPLCGPYEGGGSQAGFEETVYRSRDGGITWAKDGMLPPQTSFVGMAGGIVVSTWSSDSRSQRYWYYPDGRTLEPPQRVTGPVYPLILNPSSLLWTDDAGYFYDGAGTRLFGPLFAEQYRMTIASADPQYQHTYVTWDERPPNTQLGWLQQPWYSYVGHIDRDGQLKDLYGLPGDTLWIGGEFPRQGDGALALFGRFRFGTSRDYVQDVSFGAVLDLGNGEVHRFAELDASRPAGSFVWMQDLVTTPLDEVTARRPPFDRVTGAGDCLNVRREPSLSAPVITCLADDVLVGELGQRATADGVDWVYVRTPGSMAGWASAEFLK